MLFELVVFPQAAQWGLVIHWKSLQGSPALHSLPIWNAPFRQEGDSAAQPAGADRAEPSCLHREACLPSTLCLCKKFRHCRRLPALGTHPQIQKAKSRAEICKGVQVSSKWGRQVPSGSTGKAKENYLVLPCSESERNRLGISPALKAGWFVLEDSFPWKPAFPDSFLFHSLPIAVSGATWLPPQGRRSLKVLGLQRGRKWATYYEQFHSSFSWLCIRPEWFIIPPWMPLKHQKGRAWRSRVAGWNLLWGQCKVQG